MVHDDEAVGLDGLGVVFDDERVVSDAGIALVATLAERLQIERLAGRLVRLRGDRPGAANAARKVMALIFAMLLGADCIDDCALLGAGRTRRLLGGWLPAPSTLGTFLRAFTFGHVRQLDRLLAETITRAWRAGAGPDGGRLVVDVDSFIGEVHGYQKQGAGFGYTNKRGYHPLIASRSDSGEVLHIRLRKGKANSSRGVLRFAEELIARIARAGASGEKLLRADSAFWNNALIERLERAGWTYSISIRAQKGVAERIAAIPERDWQTLDDYPDAGEAQIAETPPGGRRMIVRRTRLIGAQAELWPDWRYFPFLTNRTDALEVVARRMRSLVQADVPLAGLTRVRPRLLARQPLNEPVRRITVSRSATIPLTTMPLRPVPTVEAHPRARMLWPRTGGPRAAPALPQRRHRGANVRHRSDDQRI